MDETKDCCSCIHAYRSTFSEVCVTCGEEMRNYVKRVPKPRVKRRTHYSEVRAMKIEEMAVWLCAHKWSNPDSALKWLKQRVDTNG